MSFVLTEKSIFYWKLFQAEPVAFDLEPEQFVQWF